MNPRSRRVAAAERAAKRDPKLVSNRERVRAVVHASRTPMRAKLIAVRAGLTYRQTLEALMALYDVGKVFRRGRKFTAMWHADPMHAARERVALDKAMFAMVRVSREEVDHDEGED